MIKDSFQLIELTARMDTPKTHSFFFVGAVIVPRKAYFTSKPNKIKQKLIVLI